MKTKVFGGHRGLKHPEDSVSNMFKSFRSTFNLQPCGTRKRLHGEVHEKHIPKTYIMNRSSMLNWSKIVHIGEGITRLWLETSGRALNHVQRSHAETGPRQWLKTRCYDFTLPLVLEVLIDMWALMSWPCFHGQCGSAQSLLPFGTTFINCYPLLQVLAQDHWQEARLERKLFSSAPQWQSVTCAQHIQSLTCCSVAVGFVVTCHYGFLGHHTW